MDSVEIIEIAKEAIIVLIKMSMPVMIVAMGVGLLISLFQALTQIQESTLSFVPKIIAIFITMILFMPFMLGLLTDFTHELAQKIITSGEG